MASSSSSPPPSSSSPPSPTPPPLQTAKLCRICKQVNFAAILTPREWDEDAGRSRTTFRPEWSGNGGAPDLAWTAYGRDSWTGPSEEYLPRIRTACYDDLSVSTGCERNWERELWKVVELSDLVGVAAAEEEEALVEEAKVGLAAGLSDIDDEDEHVLGEGSGGLGSDLGDIDGTSYQERSLSRGSDPLGKSVLAADARNTVSGFSQGEPLVAAQINHEPEALDADRIPKDTQRSQEDTFGVQANTENSFIDPSASFGDRSRSSSKPSLSRLDPEGDGKESNNGQENSDAKSQEFTLDWADYGDSDQDDDISVSTWSGHSHFTEIQRIDLEKQAQGNWDYRHGQLYYLGSIWDLRSRRHECDLCRRLWRQTRKNPDVKNEYLTKSRCILKLVELKGRRNDGSNSEVVMLNLVYIYGFKLDNPKTSEWLVRMPFVMHGTHRDVVDMRSKMPADQIIPFSDKLFGQARWREDECDYRLFREWLRVCETKHDHRMPNFSDNMAIRFIDVQRKCLVEWNGPASQVPRFVALSYVWGMQHQKVMLTTDRLDDFKQPGFLDQPLDQTIRDSIDLVSRIGENYLWIDALCILQDNREDKVTQIPQMHKIYGKAVLTIIAAAGHHADFGLPGVGVKSRTGNWFKLELDDIRVLFRSHTKLYAPSLDVGFTENYLYTSIYQSRAWTFQEGHLSTRVLVFTKDQVYWECEKCTWCEETHWESDSIDFISWRAVKDPTPLDVWTDRFERHAYDMLGADEPEKPEPVRNSYAALVKEYSNRYLSYDQDIMDGCTGVLSSIKEREQSDFLFALRTRYFGNDLLFNITKAIPRRFPGQASVEAGFPTWSWASWKGTIEIANEARNNSYDLVENLLPCDGVKCYILDTDQHGQRSLRVVNETGGWQFRQDYVKVGEGIYDPTHFDISERVSHRHEELTGSEKGSQASGSQEIPDLAHRQSNTTDQSSPTALSEPILRVEENAESSAAIANIPEYPQNLSVTDIESHPAFLELVPNFHIIFPTFSSIVVLLTEFDEMSIRMSNVIMAGTKKTRGDGVWSNQDPVQRKVYACRRKIDRTDPPSKKDSSIDPDTAVAEEAGAQGSLLENPLPCPCCGKLPAPIALPEGFEQGPYLGRLPPLSTAWDAKGYLDAVPDGVYRLLWMNNNQLPMFGHLLCKPVSESASSDGNWDGEILQRVSGVVGPPDILQREQQERYAAEWGIHILG